MALNYSQRPIMAGHHLPEENLDRDIGELLPADPFEMDINSTVSAITGWLEDLGAEYRGYGGAAEVGRGGGNGDYPLFAGWNICWNNAAMEFRSFPENVNFDSCFADKGFCNGGFGYEGANYGSIASASLIDDDDDNDWNDALVDEEKKLGHLVYDVGVRFGCDDECSGSACFDGFEKSLEVADDIGEPPHPALSYALAYLSVRDLLSVEGVCKSLCYTVRNDPLLWRNTCIDMPLSKLLTDDRLLRLTNRAQGTLDCLTLVDVQKVTEDGLKRVLYRNPRLTKLSIPGCTKVGIDGVLNCLRAFKTVAIKGIKCLRVNRIHGMTQEQFDELMSLMDIHNQVNNQKPHIFHGGKFDLFCEDDRPIDIEMCPRCQNMRPVYDCPAEGCQVKDHASQVCRACTFCISRCIQCGKCIDNCEHEETFLIEYLCSDCGGQQDVGISILKHAASQEPVVSFHG